MSDLSKQIADSLNQTIISRIDEYANKRIEEKIRERIHEQSFLIFETMDFSSRISRSYFKAVINSKKSKPWVSEILIDAVQDILDYRLLDFIEKRVDANLGDEGLETTISDYVDSAVSDHLASKEIAELIETMLMQSIAAKLLTPEFMERVDLMIGEIINNTLNKLQRSLLDLPENPLN